MEKLSSFVRRLGIRAQAEPTDSNPNMADDAEWHATANHYIVKLRRRDGDRRLQLSVTFSTGSGWDREPSANDVLDCLASDAAGVENSQSFDDWASEYGYDSDSRKAERTYRVCQRQVKRLRAFLGDDEYKQLLWNVERE